MNNNITVDAKKEFSNPTKALKDAGVVFTYGKGMQEQWVKSAPIFLSIIGGTFGDSVLLTITQNKLVVDELDEPTYMEEQWNNASRQQRNKWERREKQYYDITLRIKTTVSRCKTMMWGSCTLEF